MTVPVNFQNRFQLTRSVHHALRNVSAFSPQKVSDKMHLNTLSFNTHKDRNEAGLQTIYSWLFVVLSFLYEEIHFSMVLLTAWIVTWLVACKVGHPYVPYYPHNFLLPPPKIYWNTSWFINSSVGCRMAGVTLQWIVLLNYYDRKCLPKLSLLLWKGWGFCFMPTNVFSLFYPNAF